VSLLLRVIAIANAFGGLALAANAGAAVAVSSIIAALVMLQLASALDRIARLEQRFAEPAVGGAPPIDDAEPEQAPPLDPARASRAALDFAQDHHFAKRFGAARSAYQEIVDDFPETKAAAIARQQLDNLRRD
jgi:hypothetical protein